MAHIDRRNRGGTIRYVARYIDPAGRERSKSFTRRADGASPKKVAARAGHTSVSFVLDRYGHLFPRPTRRSGPGWTACSGRRRNTDGTRSPRTRTGHPELGPLAVS